MGYFSRFSPFRAFRDLRQFLQRRQPHELLFLTLAIAITGFFIVAFSVDSRVEPEYRPNIIYVQQWRADRSEAEILAQQKIDKVARDKRDAEQAKQDAETRAEYKRLQAQLDRYHL